MKLPNSRVLIQISLLLLILVGFPAGSFFYLKEGLEFRRGIMSRLKDYGKFPAVPGQVIWGQLPDSLQGNLLLVGYLDPTSKEAADRYGAELSKLYSQFDSVSTIRFLTVLPAAGADSAWVSAFVDRYKFLDKTQLYFLTTQPDDWQAWIKTMKWDQANNPQIALVIDARDIKAYFDLNKDEDVKDLVRLAAMIAPRKKDKELIFKREEEK